MRKIILLLSLSLFVCINAFAQDDWKDAVSIKAVDTKPSPIKQSPPVVPAELVRESGVIHISFIIDTKGKVPDAKVLKSTNDKLNQVAIDTVKTWIFKPATNVGVEIPVRAIVPLRFQ